MKHFLIVFLAVFLCASSAFALDVDSSDVYSLDSVSDVSLLSSFVSPLASSTVTGWTTTDHDYLNQIRLALTNNVTGSLLYYVSRSSIDISKIYSQVLDIKSNSDYLPNISQNSNTVSKKISLLDHLPSIAEDISDFHSDFTSGFASPFYTDFSSFKSLFETVFGDKNYYPVRFGSTVQAYSTWREVLSSMRTHLTLDAKAPWDESRYTLYHYIRNLSEVLASEDDKALADAQKANREQIEQSFASGESGGTSLGSGDFSDLSSVGTAVKDTISLNGQASISGFTGGLASADESGQGWFSAATRDALDTVSGNAVVTYSLDDDPYNMAGFEDHYNWLFGGDS